MRNTYLARVPIEIDGQRLTLQFDYAAMAAIRSEIGSDDVLIGLLHGADPKSFSMLVSIGLARNHPDWTADRVFAASPPIRPTVRAVEEALNALYFGPEGPPKGALENPLKRTLRAIRSWSPFKRRSATA